MFDTWSSLLGAGGDTVYAFNNILNNCSLSPLFTAAIELEDDTPLLNFLKQPPLRWPVLEENNGANGTWKENEFDLLETLAFLRGIFGNNILISFFVSVDDKNSDFYILKVSASMQSRLSPSICVFTPESTMAETFLPLYFFQFNVQCVPLTIRSAPQQRNQNPDWMTALQSTSIQSTWEEIHQDVTMTCAIEMLGVVR